MIPILFPATETGFDSQGLGRLAECISCTVTEERNGKYECTFKYPISGRQYAKIQEGAFILCTHDNTGDTQPFEIYARTAPIDGIVTFNARHYSYKLNSTVVLPFLATGAAAAMQAIQANALPQEFVFNTDLTSSAAYQIKTPTPARKLLGGSAGSILDTYGGEFAFDFKTVSLLASRGRNSGVIIQYGKNLKDIELSTDSSGRFNAVVPFWYHEYETGDILRLLDERIVIATGAEVVQAIPLDLSEDFEVPPTQTRMRDAAAAKLQSAGYGISENIKIDFVQLEQTEEYKSFGILQQLRLCDTVDVFYSKMGITLRNVKIIRTTYNTLLERFDSMELGDVKATLQSIVSNEAASAANSAATAQRIYTDTTVGEQIADATGENGGHIYIAKDALKKPIALYVMDTVGTATATDVLRFDGDGAAWSGSGFAGTYTQVFDLDTGKLTDGVNSWDIPGQSVKLAHDDVTAEACEKLWYYYGVTSSTPAYLGNDGFWITGTDGEYFGALADGRVVRALPYTGYPEDGLFPDEQLIRYDTNGDAEYVHMVRREAALTYTIQNAKAQTAANAMLRLRVGFTDTGVPTLQFWDASSPPTDYTGGLLALYNGRLYVNGHAVQVTQ